jgi:hypothetical protein
VAEDQLSTDGRDRRDVAVIRPSARLRVDHRIDDRAKRERWIGRECSGEAAHQLNTD